MADRRLEHRYVAGLGRARRRTGDFGRAAVRPARTHSRAPAGAGCRCCSGEWWIERWRGRPRSVTRAELGEQAIHGVAMRPSSPGGHRADWQGVGIPVARQSGLLPVCIRFFRRQGRTAHEWARRRPAYRTTVATLRRKLVSPVGRVDYARVQWVDGEIEPLATSGASILSSTVRADGFVIVPPNRKGTRPDRV